MGFPRLHAAGLAVRPGSGAAEADVAVLGVGDDEVFRPIPAGSDVGEFVSRRVILVMLLKGVPGGTWVEDVGRSSHYLAPAPVVGEGEALRPRLDGAGRGDRAERGGGYRVGERERTVDAP